ncbi:hypothetical protein pdam_00023433, partial [Pocillopora damicornis]
GFLLFHAKLFHGYTRILANIEQTLGRREVLKEHYEKVKDNLQTTEAVSETEVNDFRKVAEAYLKDLRTKRYTVLILGVEYMFTVSNLSHFTTSGETSAGKSSLINLLLGKNIMPTSIQQNTLTICEVSYGPAEEAVLHFANRRKPPRCSWDTLTKKNLPNNVLDLIYQPFIFNS